MDMASLARRPDGRIEIRETVSTPKGPRSRTLAGFRGVLTPDVLARAGGRATQPFDAEAVAARAHELGVPVSGQGASSAATQLLGLLRRGAALDPVLAGALREALADVSAREPPAQLAEVIEWVGASDRERGEALRGLLRVSDRIVASRPAGRQRRRRRFPRFDSRDRAA